MLVKEISLPSCNEHTMASKSLPPEQQPRATRMGIVLGPGVCSPNQQCWRLLAASPHSLPALRADTSKSQHPLLVLQRPQELIIKLELGQRC